MNRNDSIAVVSGARTPFAKAFTDLQVSRPSTLGCVALGDALRRAALGVDDIDEVVMGNVSGPSGRRQHRPSDRPAAQAFPSIGSHTP